MSVQTALNGLAHQPPRANLGEVTQGQINLYQSIYFD